MKLLIILLTISLTSPIWSQVTLDSSEVSKLIDKLHKLNYLEKNDSINNIQLILKDSVISTYQTEVINDNRIITNLETDNQWLRQELANLKSAGLAWWVYPSGGGLILIIGILTGLLIK